MAQTRVYELRLFDKVVLTFSVGCGFDGDFVDELNLASDGAPLPPGMQATPDGVWKWLSTRALPFNRRYADTLCIMMGIRPGDVERILAVGLGLSLNDSYWVCPVGFERRFAEVNLFENGFSDVLAAVAYTGHLDLGSSPLSGLTPELTTGGSLQKAWRIGPDGHRLLYKGSTPGWEPGEWASECLASQVAQRFAASSVRYWHDAWDDKDCSVCPSFCTRDVSYAPAALSSGSSSFAANLAFAQAAGTEALEAFADTWVFDALVCNTDRHLTNLGYLYDAPTSHLLGPAPIFDNGRALFPNVADDQLVDAAMLAELARPACGGESFAQAASRVIGERQLATLADMCDFEFNLEELPHSLHNRAKALEPFLRFRAEELSHFEPVDRINLAQACAAWRERNGATSVR